ncbi:MAG: hypothetical protein HY326_07885 [Chloroflexi bacterium]|nr:hypothetical protein [Chloroflexota bacterium]
MNIAGLQGELNLSISTIKLLRGQIDSLKGENQQLRTRLASVVPEPGSPAPAANGATRESWWRRLWG